MGDLVHRVLLGDVDGVRDELTRADDGQVRDHGHARVLKHLKFNVDKFMNCLKNILFNNIYNINGI